MKLLKQGICLALLGAGLSAAPLVSSTAAAPVAASPDGSLVSQIRAEAEGRVFTTTDRATGEVSFLRSKKDLMPGTPAASAQDAGAKVRAYLDKYAGVFGAKADQLTQSDVRKTAYGWTVEFAQSYQGVPVFGAELHAQVDESGQLTSVNGFVAPDLKGGVATRFSAAEAADRAMAAVRKAPPGELGATTDLTGIKPASSKLYVYREGAIRGVPGPNILAYAVEVSNQRNVREMVFVDANTGKVVNRYSMIDNALERELYEGSFTPANLVWEEGDDFPGTPPLLPDQQNEVLGTGESYWLYKNAFNYDSYDGNGAIMRTVNNDPTIACPNANWNGVTTNYCDGVTSDDTVSHEWGHAYTEYTSGLVYQWQPGAMNEAYSDIWGETVDIINTRFNELPDGPRTEGTCSAFTRSDVELFINLPAPIAGHCDAAPASFGPVIGTPGFTDDVVVGIPADGCAALSNAGAVAGNFVYVDRGTCTFDTKADFAEAAGATGIIVGNNAAGAPVPMPGSAGIPGLMITQAKGAAIKGATGVNATMRAIGTDPVDDSYRWLSGESDPAFGGAIRDMWTPTCYGDPGKVTDAEYHCSVDDSGGVHTNSGVVNHTFALMVDGGTYNTVTVPAIGLDKAANLFWQTQDAHLGPISDFTDLADSLEASCTELEGEDINQMDVTPNAGPTLAADITPADCAAVTQAIAATQLRTEPTQCGFQPLLQQGAPALTCGAGTTLKNVFTEDFEDGLVGWTAEAEIVYPGGGSTPWVADDDPPGTHTGGTARGVDDSVGDCTEAAGDFSSRDTIISPAFTMPANVTGAKLSFDHYVATEPGYDGGNVKVSVNGGAFTQIPLSAFVFNPYNTTLLDTNPLGGQVGFSGTDGGVPAGSWATTIVNLSGIGVTAGAQVRLRLDMGRDGCGGLDGWYVDNIKVTACESPSTPGMLASTTSASADPKKIVRGKSFKVNVTVGASGATPAGTVDIYKGTKLLATGTLANGKVTIKVSKKMAKKLKKGKNTLTAKYLGSATVAASQGDFVVKVKKKRK